MMELIVASSLSLIAVALAVLVGMRWARPSAAVQSPAPQVFVRNWKPMTDDQLRATLGGWKETDPKWRALWDSISRELEAELSGITSVSSNPQELARWAGRIETLLQWRRQLAHWRQLPSEDGDYE